MNELRKCSTRESCGETTGHQTPDLDFCQVITELRVVPSSTKAAHRHKSGAHCALCDSDSLCSVSTGPALENPCYVASEHGMVLIIFPLANLVKFTTH